MFTTLKALKWAYSLGVRQERVRIAAYLKNRLSQSSVNSATYQGMFDDPKAKIGKERRKKIEKAIAVEYEINELIGEILQPNWEQTMSASIMFPDDEHKGKVK